jgi:hypothetical protein
MGVTNCMGLGETVIAYTIVIRNTEGKRPLVSPRHRWEDNIKTNIKEVECTDVDWIRLSWGSISGVSFEHCNKPLDSAKGPGIPLSAVRLCFSRLTDPWN